MKFSQRIGKKPVKSALQVESIDDDLLNRLWNTLIDNFFNRIPSAAISGNKISKENVCRHIWKEFFNYKVDEIPTYWQGSINPSKVIENIKKWFYEKAEWYEIYDLVEFISDIDSQINKGFIKNCNYALKIEASGYRIINQRIVQVTSEEEINEIEEAIHETSAWKPINNHLSSALSFLADRKNPNYRNSIKESISAVESLCKIITGDDSATLGKALREFENHYTLHGALKNAFNSLYGYTSDSSGIRHALLEKDVSVEFDDAKFMLVSCSAFINYLKSKTKLYKE